MQRENGTYFDDETISIYEILIAMKKRIWLISIIALILFLSFTSYSIIAPGVYRAYNVMIINPDIEINPMKETADIKAILTSLAKMPRLEQTELLDLEEQSMRFVKEIVISEILESSSLKIEIDILKRELAPPIIKAIVDYVNKLPYIQKKMALQIKIKRKTKNEIQKIIDNPIRYLNLPQNTMMSQILSSMYAIRDRYNNLTYVLEALERGDFVTLAKATHVPSRPYKPARAKIVLLGLCVGAFLGLFIGLMLEWIGSARREYETR